MGPRNLLPMVMMRSSGGSIKGILLGSEPRSCKVACRMGSLGGHGGMLGNRLRYLTAHTCISEVPC